MVKLNAVVDLVSGSPQFRIKEAFDDKAPLYTYYGQKELEADLVEMNSEHDTSKQVRTFDEVNTLSQNDVVFSLISGKSTIVGLNHEGYLYTQNYVKLVHSEKIDSKYLVYLLNEDDFIKKQLQLSLQGSQVLKYTLKQLNELDLPALPTIEKQRTIGDLYLNQLRLETLKIRTANLETVKVLEQIKGMSSIQ